MQEVNPRLPLPESRPHSPGLTRDLGRGAEA